MKYCRWTNREVELLGELYPTTPWPDMMKALPGHSFYSIAAMARKQRFRRNQRVSRWLKVAQHHKPVVLR
jgi:hypothetical protein